MAGGDWPLIFTPLFVLVRPGFAVGCSSSHVKYRQSQMIGLTIKGQSYVNYTLYRQSLGRTIYVMSYNNNVVRIFYLDSTLFNGSFGNSYQGNNQKVLIHQIKRDILCSLTHRCSLKVQFKTSSLSSINLVFSFSLSVSEVFIYESRKLNMDFLNVVNLLKEVVINSCIQCSNNLLAVSTDCRSVVTSPILYRKLFNDPSDCRENILSPRIRTISSAQLLIISRACTLTIRFLSCSRSCLFSSRNILFAALLLLTDQTVIPASTPVATASTSVPMPVSQVGSITSYYNMLR